MIRPEYDPTDFLQFQDERPPLARADSEVEPSLSQRQKTLEKEGEVSGLIVSDGVTCLLLVSFLSSKDTNFGDGTYRPLESCVVVASLVKYTSPFRNLKKTDVFSNRVLLKRASNRGDLRERERERVETGVLFATLYIDGSKGDHFAVKKARTDTKPSLRSKGTGGGHFLCAL